MVNPKLAILFLFLLFSNICFAQDNKLLRIELEAADKEYLYYVVPAGDMGMILFYRTTNTSESGIDWYFTFYDVNLDKISSKEISVNEKLTYVKEYRNNHSVYLYFQENEKRAKNNNYSLVVIDIENKSHEIINGVFRDEGTINDFRVFDDQAFFVFKSNNGYATVLARDLTGENTVDLFDNERDVLEIDKMTIDTISGSLHMVLKKSINKRQYTMHYYEFDKSGVIIDSLMIRSRSEDIVLNKGMLRLNSEDEKIIIGTYIDTKGRSAKNVSDSENESSGIYFAKIADNDLLSIKFFSYLEFKNFSVYLSDSEFVKYIRKTEKKGGKGKDFSINYNLLVHDILKFDDQYIFAAEAYYPEYRTVSYMTYDYYGRPVPQYYSVFDGYRYTNALIASFDPDGNVLWSNVFDLYKILSFSLKKRVNFFCDTSGIVLSYSDKGQIVSQVIDGYDIVGASDFTDIKPKHFNDEIISDERNELEHWYGNYFIAYGYQTIKNNYLPGKRKRTVFYVNKLAFQ